MHVKFSATADFLFVSALLFLTLLCSAAAPLSYGCLSDEFMKSRGPLPSVIPQEPNVFAAFALSDVWEPLRIKVSDEDLRDPTKHCTENDVGPKKDVKRNNLQGKEEQCHHSDVLKPEIIKSLLEDVLPRAIKLHTDRLLVQRSRAPLKIPVFAKDDICANFTVPAAHRNPGVSDADMVLYVAGAPLRAHGNTKFLAWAVPCAQLNQRPVAAAMNFAADKVIFSRHTVRITAHEVAHALGFMVSHMEAKKMTEKIQVRPKNTVTVVTSAQTKAKAQQHYGCTTAKGMELQMDEKNAPLSHWSRRNAKDELMAPLRRNEESFLGLYSALTLAAFEDLGYYKVHFEMAEPMSWGRDASCKFLDEPCVKGGVSQTPSMFCAAQNYTQQACTSDRTGVGRCSLLTSISSIPVQFKYFLDPKHGGDWDELTDYCPVIARQSGVFCTRTTSSYMASTGSLQGVDSWCLDGVSLVAVKYKKNESIDGVCAEVKCDGGAVKVKYNGNDNFHLCPEGETISPQSDVLVGGAIKCPKYSEVCTVASDGSSILKVPQQRTTQKPIAEEMKTSAATQKPIAEETKTSAAMRKGNAGNSDGTAGPNSALLGPSLLAMAVIFCAAALQV